MPKYVFATAVLAAAPFGVVTKCENTDYPFGVVTMVTTPIALFGVVTKCNNTDCTFGVVTMVTTLITHSAVSQLRHHRFAHSVVLRM